MINNIIDPTQVGTSGLRGLNTKEGQDRLANEYGLSKSLSEFKIRKANAPIELPEQEVGMVGLGESRYDEDITSLSQLEDLENTRGEIQPWYSKIGAGIGKGAVLAGTTFLDGTLGTIVGAMNVVDSAIKGEAASHIFEAFWDNPFAQAMKAVNDWSEEALPNYMTEEEKQNQENGEWYKNFFTANWWGNSFIKNIGFSVGAFATGNLLSGALKGAPAMVKSIVGSTISAINEGKVEALNNSNDWYELEKKKLDEARDAELAELKQNYGNLDSYESLVNNVGLVYKESLAKLNKDKAKVGNIILAANIPLLAGSNYYMWGKLYAGGAKSAIRNTNIAKRNGKYVNEMTALKLFTGPTSEGLEELEQKSAATIPGLKYGSEVENFYKSKWDPEAAEDTLNWVQSTMKGISETVGDKASWEEFTIGAMTGAMGMPMFRNPKTKDGWRSPVTLEGNIISNALDYKKEKDTADSMVQALNERVSSPEFLNYYQGMVRHTKLQNDMNRAAEEGDEYEYKNAEDSQLISDIIMFDKAGRLNDLTDMLNQAFDTSDENVQTIINSTTDKEGNGPDSTGGNSISKDEVKKKLTESKDNILKQIEIYKTIKDRINLKVGDKITDDQLEELTWLGAKSNVWESRLNSMANEVKEQLKTVLADLEYRSPSNKHIPLISQLLSMPNELLAPILSDAKYAAQRDGIFKLAKDLNTKYNNKLGFEDLGIKLNDMVKVANAISQFDVKLNEYLKDPSKLQDKMDKDKEEVADVELKKERAEILNKINSAKSFSDLQDMEVSSVATEDEITSSSNPLGKEYKKARKFFNEVIENINNSGYSESQKKVLYDILGKRYKEEQNLSDLMNSSIITEYNNVDADGEIMNGESLSTLLDRARDTVENSDIPDAETINPNNVENVSSETTGNDKTGTIPTESNKNTITKLTDLVNTSLDKDRVKDIITPLINESKEAVKKAIETKEEKDIDSAYAVLFRLGNEIGSLPEASNDDFMNSFESIINNIYSKMPKPNPDITEEELREITVNDPELEEGNALFNSESKSYDFYRSDITPYTIDSFNDGTFIPFATANHNYKEVYDKIDFEYINKGNIKTGDKLHLKIEKVGEYDCTFMYHNDHIVGILPTINRTGYKGIKGVNERIQKGEDVTLTVSKIMLGRYRFNKDKTQSVKNIAGLDSNVQFGVYAPIKGKLQLITNNDISTEPVFNELNADGRVYLLLKNSRGTYSPKLLRIKHFNREEFNLDILKSTNNSRAKELHSILEAVSKATNPDQIDELAGRLDRVLHVKGLLHMNMVTMDNNTVLTLHGKAGRKNIVMVRGGDGSITIGDNGIPIYSEDKSIPSEEIYNTLLDYLYSLNPVFNVRASKVNKDDYNQKLLDDDILYTHITDAEMIGSWFTTTWYDDAGVEQEAKNPKGKFVVNAKTDGTRITVKGKKYYVKGDAVYDINENKVEGDTQLIRDLAYCEQNFGSAINGTRMDNGKVLLPGDTRAINVITQKYLTPQEVKDLKDTLAGRPTAKQKAESTLLKLNEDQNKVKRDANGIPDTSENKAGESVYRILEEDGKYHEYKRVHSVIGSNWATEPDENVKQLGKYAISWGDVVDELSRQFFGGNTNIQKPTNMSDAAFGSLMKRLTEIRNHLERTGERFLVNRVVVFRKLPDGTRVAGELDALSVNTITGKFAIYDFKTSKYTFHATGGSIDKYATKYNKNQTRSNKEQHTLQLSGYKNMFDASYDSSIDSLWIIPFNINYTKDESLNQVIGEQTIPLTYNPSVPINTGKVVIPTTPPVTNPTMASMNPPSADEVKTFNIGDKVLYTAGSSKGTGTITKISNTGKSYTIKRDSNNREVEVSLNMISKLDSTNTKLSTSTTSVSLEKEEVTPKISKKYSINYSGLMEAKEGLRKSDRPKYLRFTNLENEGKKIELLMAEIYNNPAMYTSINTPIILELIKGTEFEDFSKFITVETIEEPVKKPISEPSRPESKPVEEKKVETKPQQTGDTSYFELNDEVVTAPTQVIGNLDGNEIRMYKKPIITSGIGGVGAGVAFYDYYAILPNGAAIPCIKKQMMTDDSASNIIMNIINSNKDTVMQEMKRTTKLGSYIKPDNKISKLKEAQARLNSTNKQEGRGNMNNVAKESEKLNTPEPKTSDKSYPNWDKLDDDTQALLSMAGYDAATWNNSSPEERDSAIGCFDI